ncbi:hypothetical protein BA895_01120 [Humibacillus sp. DSM 29435]|uniref:hypothetical protein n=1 Tax=Humibacillus sp. DSM 29435 TaxID=1869167 RepID=UPI00087202A9|nr:hypothetical protein [Humibacillus sp. DSM 29435]OFE18815.1 hypothetical protein BA895_01120 [Humibacillus sp. DSM 29435]
MTSAPTTNIPVAIPAGQRSPEQPQPANTIAGSLSGIPGARTVANRLLHGTPGRMRLFGLLAVVAALVLGLVSVTALLASQNAVERAANNTSQVVLAQSLHVDLLRADAIATNAFLVGGLEPPASRQAYESAMASVARGIAQGAAAQPADAEALGLLSTQVQQYAALVEQARTNNRSGLPLGAQYLKQASAGLRSDAIPTVSAVVSANEQRAQAEFDRSNSSLQLAFGVLALIVLIAVAVWLARRTHRYVNVSLTAGIVLLLVGLVVASVTIGSISQATKQVSTGAYRQAVALADVRTYANDARANESLTLIARGSGQANQDAWTNASDQVEKILRDNRLGSLESQWTAYAKSHAAIRTLDDGGNWDKAVAEATKSSAGSASAQFTAFDTSVTQARDDASGSAVQQLRSLGGSAPWFALAIGLGTLVACWLVIRGIGKRIEEYR